MLLWRKIDLYLQLAIAVLSVISIPFSMGLGFLFGLFVIGCWQILSAVINTHAFINTGFKKRIYYYWIFCFADLLLFLFAYHLEFELSVFLNGWLFIISLSSAIVIAVYYLRIYNKLIDLISLRNELDGLTKSKH